MGQFCANCGTTDKKLYEFFCEDCYWKDHKLVTPNQSNLDVPYCLTCYSIRLPTGWSTSNELDEIPEAIAYGFSPQLNLSLEMSFEFKINHEKINWIATNPDILIDYYVSSSEITEFAEYTEHVPINVKLQGGICKSCVRKKTGGGEVIVQLRALNRDLTKWEKRKATNLGQEIAGQHSFENPGAYLSDVIEYHGGIDLYFGSSAVAESFLTRLRGMWIGHHEKNFRLVTEDKKGKRIYEVTHLYRIPWALRGSIVEYNNTLLKVRGMTKKGIKVVNLVNNERTTIKEWEKVISPNPPIFMVRKLVVSKDVSAETYLLLDLKDYTDEEVSIHQFATPLEIGKEIEFIIWHDKYYVE